MSDFQHPPLKTTIQLIERYGNPIIHTHEFESKWMIMYVLSDNIHKAIPVFPAHIYMNKDIVEPFENTCNYLIEKGLHREIKTWDGCFNVRAQRGTTTAISRHSFGIALDINASWNALYGTVNWSEEFLNVWRNTGWICGADFHSRIDGMHFERTAANSW